MRDAGLSIKAWLDINDNDYDKDHSDGELADTIIDGNGDMPSFGNQYTDQEISDVLAYIRTLQ